MKKNSPLRTNVYIFEIKDSAGNRENTESGQWNTGPDNLASSMAAKAASI